MSTDLPPPITGDADDLEQVLGELPALPDGFRWQLEFHAETEVVRADGTIEG